MLALSREFSTPGGPIFLSIRESAENKAKLISHHNKILNTYERIPVHGIGGLDLPLNHGDAPSLCHYITTKYQTEMISEHQTDHIIYLHIPHAKRDDMSLVANDLIPDLLEIVPKNWHEIFFSPAILGTDPFAKLLHECKITLDIEHCMLKENSKTRRGSHFCSSQGNSGIKIDLETDATTTPQPTSPFNFEYQEQHDDTEEEDEAPTVNDTNALLRTNQAFIREYLKENSSNHNTPTKQTSQQVVNNQTTSTETEPFPQAPTPTSAIMDESMETTDPHPDDTEADPITPTKPPNKRKRQPHSLTDTTKDDDPPS
jgi:hypothetical protein